ncbi:MAG: YciI family protein [Actinophytocola sp.]|uniref:YciI family protein n=1 Tax=Actinophytocola sp. TaxID=1872138 RepID=UPI003D6A52A4
MRFLVLATAEGVPPTAAALWRYNEELARAGVLLAADVPASSARGARVRFAGGRATFEECEVPDPASGYWLIEVASRREALAWVRRCPCDGEIEIRRVLEPADAVSPEHEDYLRAQIAYRVPSR